MAGRKLARVLPLGILLACKTSSSERVIPQPVTAQDAAAPTAHVELVVPSDAGSLPPFRVGVGARPDEEVAPFDGVTASAEGLCKTFLQVAKRDAEEIAKTFSFPQLEPSCVMRPAPAAFEPAGAFLDARVLAVNHVSREQKLLALRLARGWVITWLKWDVLDTESATPMWATEAPERFEANGDRLVVYLPGADVTTHGARWLRGAYACRDDGAQLLCSKWDPTERMPLGEKDPPKKDRRTATAAPWKNAADLQWQADGAWVPQALGR